MAAKKKPGRPPAAKVTPPRMAAPTGDALTDARAHLEWINGCIAVAELSGAAVKELVGLSAQKSGAMKYIASLTGAYNITESKIVRSEPFLRMMSELERVLDKHPDAVAALKKWADGYT